MVAWRGSCCRTFIPVGEVEAVVPPMGTNSIPTAAQHAGKCEQTDARCVSRVRGVIQGIIQGIMHHATVLPGQQDPLCGLLSPSGFVSLAVH
jgi:hypothetical protein